jgi:glycosyltransferase involved in cell wall biosynthesis
LFYASPRIPGLVKYIPEFGWDGIVLTVPIGEDPEARFGPPNDFKNKYRVVETEGYQQKGDIGEQALKRFNLASKKSYRYLRPFLRIPYRFYSEVFSYPDKEKGWRSPAIKVAERLLEHGKVDAIISSSPPATCHIIAKELKDKHEIHWIADFRDLWTQNVAYPYSGLRKRVERRLELETLKRADALVTVSSPTADDLKELHKREGVHVITNGFDLERLNEKETALTPKFTITYTGQIYAGKRDPLKLLIALRELIDDGTIEPNDVEVRFYGPLDGLLAREIEKRRLSDIVQQHGVVPRGVALQRQKESHALLLLNWEDPTEKGVYTGKIFEYLASKRPILSTGGFGNDVIEALLKETKAGVYCRTAEDVKSALKVFYLEYKNSGTVRYTGDVEKVNKYSYREMARQFAAVLDKSLSAK